MTTNCYHVVMSNAVGDFIKERYKKRGYSQRSLSDAFNEKLKTNKHWTTVQRYMNGSEVPLDHAKVLAELLTDNHEDKRDFLRLCREATIESEEEKKQRTMLKKAYTEAKNTFDCKVTWTTIYSEAKGFLEIEIGALILNGEKPVMKFSSTGRLIRLFDEKGDTVNEYFKVCHSFGVSPYGIPELVRRSLVHSDLINQIDNEQVLVNRQQLASWPSRLKTADSVKSKQQAENMKTGVFAEMKAYAEQSKELRKGRDKLIAKIRKFTEEFKSLVSTKK